MMTINGRHATLSDAAMRQMDELAQLAGGEPQATTVAMYFGVPTRVAYAMIGEWHRIRVAQEVPK